MRAPNRPDAALAAFVERVHAFDDEPRTIVFGALVGAGMAVLMAAGLDARIRDAGWLVVAVGLAAPSAGLTALATIALFREPLGLGPLGFNATVVGACALGVTGRLMMGGLVSRRTSFRPEFVAIAAFLGLSAFQYLSIATQITDERERFARTQLTNVESGLLLVILVAVTFSTRSRRLLVAALVPGIVIASIAAIASLSPAILGALPIGGLLPSQDISARGTGIFLNPNYMGQAVAMAVLLLGNARRLDLPLGLSRRPWLGALPPLLALGASFSRGAAVAFVSGVVALYWSRGRRMFIGAALGGVVVIVVGYPILLGVRHSLTFGPDIAASEEAQQVSDGSRIAAARAGFRLFLSRPLTGVGYGQFHYESPGYLGASPITYAHNSYIQIAAEQGLVGIAAFLLALLALYLALSARADAYAITARAMLVAFAVGSLFAEPVTSYQTSAILWLVVGTALVQVAPTVSAGPAGEVDDWHTVTQRWVATPAT